MKVFSSAKKHDFIKILLGFSIVEYGALCLMDIMSTAVPNILYTTSTSFFAYTIILCLFISVYLLLSYSFAYLKKHHQFVAKHLLLVYFVTQPVEFCKFVAIYLLLV